MKSKFFENYKELKEKEDWHTIIEYGLHDLATEELTIAQESLVRVRIASCYHYQGKFDEAILQAKCVTDQSGICADPNILARAYYLLSASYRSLISKVIDEKDKQIYIKEAKSAIANALALENKLNKFTKAKVFFNAGALQQDQDVEENYKITLGYYSKSLELFEKNSDDYNRTMIRNIGCKLKIGNVNFVIEQEMRELFYHVKKDSKTYVHLLQLQSNISKKQERYPESYKYATEAFEIANSKNMNGDISRLKILIKQILEKDPKASDSNLWQNKDSQEFLLNK